ncbi:hypothetical protein [Azospirillum halopraeferens]|uniref:hypothetical protein n=1 Tax=Azospirillum halopraeferens TaxID=34010 RepID=UPI00041C8372|nr:hypothetical protein [Azospirillum halopraeferens]
MRVLKAAVIIMGVFIVLGYVYLGLEVYKRMTRSGEPAEAADDRPALSVTTAGEIALGLPPGARIAEMLAVGTRVVFRVTVPDGAERLYVLDPRDGTVGPVVTTGAAAPRPAPPTVPPIPPAVPVQ